MTEEKMTDIKNDVTDIPSDRSDVKSNVIIDDGRIEQIGDYQGPEDLYQDLISRVRKYHPSDDISLTNCESLHYVHLYSYSSVHLAPLSTGRIPSH